MARGYGGTFGTGTGDNLQGGTNITIGTTVSYAVWIWINDPAGADASGFGDVLTFSSGAPFLQSYTKTGVNAGLKFARSWTGANATWRVTTPASNVWTHFAVTYDGGSTSNDPLMYINGVAQSTTEDATPSGSLSAITKPPFIGSEDDLASAWNGALAEFGFWNNTILTSNEIQSLANGTLPFNIRNTALTFYIPMLGTQATEPDWGPNRYTMTNTGTRFQPHAPVRQLNALTRGAA